MILAEAIERLFDTPAVKIDRSDAMQVVGQLIGLLNKGEVRAAEKLGGAWQVNSWVKKGILLAFRLGNLKEFDSGQPFQFFDKDTLDVKKFSLEENVRIVPGGSIVRNGAYLAKGVVIMPPSYVNIGAYVDGGTMIDSHALIGSCAQIGMRVHLSAAAQVGGVLEPVGSMPVIIEDDVFVGGNCGIYEGTVVKKRAVIAAGVILTGSTGVYDLVNEKIYRKSQTGQLVIPEGAVVVAGCRGFKSPFAEKHSLSIYTPVIIKYRDEKTDAATVLEESLR